VDELTIDTRMKFRMDDTLVAATAFLVIHAKALAPPFYPELLLSYKVSGAFTTPMKERSRLHSRRTMDRVNILPIGSHALLNSLPVCCLCHKLRIRVLDGNTGPPIHPDGAVRAP
jgi:hypothetical protein